MKSEENHTQCFLVSEDGIQMMSWIPSVRAAKLNKVKIDGRIFTVKERYSTIPTQEAIGNSSDYRRHRKATDKSEWQKLEWGKNK
jgi:hypothetical protein